MVWTMCRTFNANMHTRLGPSCVDVPLFHKHWITLVQHSYLLGSDRGMPIFTSFRGVHISPCNLLSRKNVLKCTKKCIISATGKCISAAILTLCTGKCAGATNWTLCMYVYWEMY